MKQSTSSVQSSGVLPLLGILVSLMLPADHAIASGDTPRIASVAVDSASNQLVVRGTFGSTSIAVLLADDQLSCPQVSLSSITCQIPSDVPPGSYRLDVFEGLNEDKVITTTGKERPVQFRSTIDVALGTPLYPPNVNNVLTFGATGNGIDDDTQAIANAVAATSEGGVVYFPPGRYRISSTLTIDRSMTIRGDGIGSQIYQSTNGADVLHLVGVEAASVRDLFLGSISTSPGSSLIRMTNSHRNRIDDVIMLGAHRGISLEGSLLNNFVGLKSGINFQQSFFETFSTNQYWVYLEPLNQISSNANTFVSPVLEGGTNGILMNETASQGNLTIVGGTIEGVSGVGLKVTGTFLPVLVSGVHFEANGAADIIIDNARNVRIESILGTGLTDLSGAAGQVQVANSVIDSIRIGSNVVGAQLANVMFDLSGSGGITNLADDTMFINVVPTTAGHVDWFNTLGIGVRNPNSNPVGLTPDRKVHVVGKIHEEPVP